MSKWFLVLIFIIGFIFYTPSVNAQVVSGDVILEIFPPNPSPNQNVKARLSTYATDLNKAYVVWTVNGNRVSGGIGKTVYNFNTNEFGNSIEIIATIETLSGESLTKKERITPLSVDMLWEAVDSYAPPFYRGKTLVSSEGSFKIVAMPNIAGTTGAMDPKNFSYAWEKDGKNQNTASGWGKNSFTFKKSFLDTVNQVAVKISSLNNSVNTGGKISIGTSAPKIVLYREDPILGIQTQESLKSGFAVGEDGAIIVAVPYFMTTKDIKMSNLEFDWMVGSTQVPIQEPKNKIAVKPDKNRKGNAVVGVTVNNYNNVATPKISKQISVSF